MSTHPTFADVTDALARYSERVSKAEANQVLESVAGTTSLRDVDPTLYAKAIAALDGVEEDGSKEEPHESMLDDEGGLNVGQIYAKWNAAGAPRPKD